MMSKGSGLIKPKQHGPVLNLTPLATQCHYLQLRQPSNTESAITGSQKSQSTNQVAILEWKNAETREEPTFAKGSCMCNIHKALTKTAKLKYIIIMEPQVPEMQQATELYS